MADARLTVVYTAVYTEAMRAIKPSEKLFQLLDHCGLRQCDVAAYCGVSKTLTSKWYAHERTVSDAYHTALRHYADSIFRERWYQEFPEARPTEPHDPPLNADHPRWQAYTMFQDAALLERHRDVWRSLLAQDVSQLTALVTAQLQKDDWPSQGATAIRNTLRSIATAVQLLTEEQQATRVSESA